MKPFLREAFAQASLVLLFLFVSIFSCEPKAFCSHLSGKSSYSYTEHSAGFFASFQIALGMLECYEQKKIVGVEVNFGKTGYYYEPSRGLNWWSYYFNPLMVVRDHKKPKKKVIVTYVWNGIIAKFDYVGRHLDRYEGARLIAKYIHIRPEIMAECNAFIREKMQGKPYIAVHYRGTDKQGGESYPISKQEVVEQIKALLCMGAYKDHRIFVATDEAQFVTLMQKEFGNRVVSMPNLRSSNGRSFHQCGNLSGYQKGKEALLDCLILSKAAFLFRTSSNLSQVSLFFNPNLPNLCVNEK